jgi:3-hydroxy-3-methylglutaryl CoA synthase
MGIDITGIGAYIPYYYIPRDIIGKAWQTKGQKGERSLANVDEDSITMAMEATDNCFDFISR